MIDIATFTDKLDIAIQQKNNLNYKKKIVSELSKPEWAQQKYDLDRLSSNIKDEHDFLNYQKSLVKFFEKIYEIITAPGVDDFVDWINNITDNKNVTNTKKLREYLVANFTESTLSLSIEGILINKEELIKEKSIFSSLLTEIYKQFKKRCDNFIGKPAEFANNIDEFLDEIKADLDGIKGIAELSYTNEIQFYSKEQRANNVEFYSEIIKLIVDKNQNLKPINDSDKALDLVARIKNRISDIKKCINLLDTLEIANSNDNTLKNLFLKFDKEMVNFDKGVYVFLDEFIDKVWSEIESNYDSIRVFFESKQNLAYSIDWESYPKKNKISSLLDDYGEVTTDNILPTILSKTTSEIPKILRSKANKIEKYFGAALQLKNEISEVFKTFLTEYETKKLTLAVNLSSGNKAMEKIAGDIKQSIEGLDNGIKSLEARDDMIAYLKDDFTSDLNTYNDIRNWFENVLQQSGMSPHLTWLESKLTDSEKGTINISDFNNPKLIKELLEKGLIKIEIEKTF